MFTKTEKSKSKIEKTLSMLGLKKIDPVDMDNSKKQVWNQLTYSIDKYNELKDYNDAKHVSNTKSFFNSKFSRSLNFAMTFILIISFLFSAIFIAYKKIPTHNIAQQNQNNVENSDIDVKALAASRFEQLNGISYEKLSTVKNSTTPALSSDAASAMKSTKALNNAFIPEYREDVSLIDESKAKLISNEISDGDQKVTYTEQKITLNHIDELSSNILNFAGPGDISKHPKVDLTKPFTMKSWYNPNYSKFIVSQGENIISLHLNTPKFSLEYLGGKFAVKHEFDNDQLLTAYVQNEDINPEMSFLKEILSNESIFKKSGTQEYNRAKLQIFEVDHGTDSIKGTGKESSGINSTDKHLKTKYFVNVSDFKLILVQEFSDDKMYSSLENISFSQSSLKDSIDNLTSYNEITGIDVKQILKSDNLIATPAIPNDQVVNFIKKYNIYYFTNLKEKVTSAATYDSLSENESLNYYLSKDFNPMLEDSIDDQISLRPLGYYGQSDFSFSVYKDEPKLSSIKGTANTVYEKDIQIEDKKIKAKFIEQEPDKNSFPPEDKNQIQVTGIQKPNSTSGKVIGIIKSTTIIFSQDNLWYEVNITSIKDNLDTNSLKLAKLTLPEAEAIDKEIKDKANSYPDIHVIKLSDVKKDLLLLPGDLSKEYKLLAGSVTASSRKGNDSTCDKYEINLYSGCLIEKFNGYQMQFMPIEDSQHNGTVPQPLNTVPVTVTGGKSVNVAEPSISNYFTLIVLDTKLETAKPLIDKLNEFNIPEDMTSSSYIKLTKEINGKTILLFGVISDSDIKKIADGIKLNNGYAELDKQIGNVTEEFTTQPGMPSLKAQ